MTNEKGRQAMKEVQTQTPSPSAAEAQKQTIIDVDPAAPRPLAAMALLRQAYPDVWRGAELAQRWRQENPARCWPEWCVMPIAASIGVIADAVRAASGGTVRDGRDAHDAALEHPLAEVAGLLGVRRLALAASN